MPGHDEKGIVLENWLLFQRLSGLFGVPPGYVPVLARGIDDAAVGLEEFVGNLEDRKHQPAFRTQGDVAADLLSTDEFAGLAFSVLSGAMLFDETASMSLV